MRWPVMFGWKRWADAGKMHYDDQLVWVYESIKSREMFWAAMIDLIAIGIEPDKHNKRGIV